MTDRQRLFACAFLRATAIGMMGVQLGMYLAARDFDGGAVGTVVSAGLAGNAAAALLATLRADRLGRRRFLVAMSLLGAAGGILLAATAHLAAAALVAFLGMANGQGRDRGPALIVEQSILPSTVGDAERTRTFAWYNVLQDGGHALGAVLAGVPGILAEVGVASRVGGHQAGLALYAGLMLAGAWLATRLTAAVEPAAPAARRLRVAPESRRILTRISALFALDSVAGGFLTTSLLSYFFFERFGAGELAVGALFFGARVLNALSHLAAAWLAKHIGLVNTMVFTHIPSSLLLATVAIAPSFEVAAILFLLREGLVEMDVPTRQSYVMAVVRPEERTVAAGVTHLVRLGGWAVAPVFAGWFMEDVTLLGPLVIGAGMKILYDLLLWRAFRGIRPPEERVEA